MGNLDGRRFQRLAINLETGERKLAAKRVRWFNGPSPDGEWFLYFEDGHYIAYSMKTRQSRNLTQGGPVSFVDMEDDGNVDQAADAGRWAGRATASGAGRR